MDRCARCHAAIATNSAVRENDKTYHTSCAPSQREKEHMGEIKIEVSGSFLMSGTEIITAERGGHAAAIGRAIILLADRLPSAIEQDHKLHDSGDLPPRAKWGQER